MNKLLALLLVLSSPVNADDRDVVGKVIKIKDGDTLEILTANNQRIPVRLGHIDAPEKSQDFGRVSKKLLSDICYGKQAEVKFIEYDKYKRIVGDVMCDGEYANFLLVNNGLAWVFTRYSHDPLMIAAESKAKANRLGLWVNPNPIPPWEYRKSKKQYTSD